ncbi:S9 family peptidase [Pseudoalteromonas tunicata]|uniref:S9 family peptidase n=1 Tax=Pseudoalteromonas tunicata TaxID=314281 RepID=UPI00273EA6A1|nr:S9 family peptidase [Pseudoalteromonas tunicata]MDP5212244.1 S9 family peptidase [Pseudoalteromonas tunicata]
MAKSTLSAPVAVKQPHVMTHHQHSRCDNYYWMRDDERQDPKIIAHLEAENAYCDAQMSPYQVLEQDLFTELKGRIVKDDSTVPVKDGAYWYSSEISGEEEFARYYRADDGHATNKQLLLDSNTLAQEHEYYDLGEFSISPNDQLLSYSEDTDSRRIYTIRFKDLTTNTLLDDVLENTEGQAVWANDNKTVFYVKKDLKTLLGSQVYRHVLGTSQADDVLVFEEQDDSFFMGLGKSRDESLIMLDLEATETSDTWVLDANNCHGEFVQLCPRVKGHEYDADKLGDTYYIVTNWQAKNFRLMTANNTTIHQQALWQELIAHRDDVMLECVELFNEFKVVTEREKGQIRFVVYQADGSSYPLEFNDACYYAGLGENPEPDSNKARLYYSSLTTPGSLLEFDLATGQSTVLKQQKVLGDFDSTLYQAERIFIKARDGVEVPVSLVYRKDMFGKNSQNPMLLNGYGAYGITFDASFSVNALSLLDRGFVYAIAHIRGSEMLGRDWYEQGKKAHKQNTFNDFVDVTQALVQQGYAHADKVFASGASAGGLLMGAVANQAPHLYKGICCQVPFLDVLTTMLDESIPLTTNEYDEWGNPNDVDAYKTILAYSPYDNIRAQDYPNILVTTGFHDSQVQYWEPMKWVAKLRELKTNNNLLLFKTDMDAGHGGASGRFNRLKEEALELAFFIGLLQDKK